MVKIVDGKKIAEELEEELAREIVFLKKKGVSPKLVSITIGDNPISRLYLSLKQKAAQRVEMEFEKKEFSSLVECRVLEKFINSKNKDKEVHGIVVQRPIWDAQGREAKAKTIEILSLIEPKKDVDCLTPENFGLMAMGKPRFLPATVEAVLAILSSEKIGVSGKNIVVVGASDITGKPLAISLENLNKEGTVTICHDKTKNLPFFTRKAEIIISATGVPNLIKAQMVKKGVVLIDVGEIRLKDKIASDIDFDQVKRIASIITPVPGGVGPVTVSCLLKNVVKAAKSLA